MMEMRVPFFSRRSVQILSVAGVLLAAGCSGSAKGPELALAKGSVHYQGKPLTFGQIFFVPDRSRGTTGPMASSTINERGEFELETLPPQKGAVIGFHKVIVNCYKATPFDPNHPSPPLEEISLIPAKYGDENTTDLTAEVVKSPEKNVFIFELK